MRRLFANLAYLVLGLPLALSALALLAVRPVASDRDFYRRMVDDDRLYVVLADPEVAKAAPAVLQLGGADFDGRLLAAAVQRNLPKAEIKAFGDRLIDQAFEAGDASNTRAIPVDLRPIKSALGARESAVASTYAAALPSRSGTAPASDLTWRPSSVSVPTEAASAAAALGRGVGALPDTVDVGAAAGLGRSTPALRLARAGVGGGAVILAALSAILISGLAYIGADSARRRLTKAGRMVLWPSLLVLAGGALLSLPGQIAASGLLPSGMRLFGTGATGSALAGYLAAILGGAAKGFFVTGLIGSSLGGLLISMRRLFEPREIE